MKSQAKTDQTIRVKTRNHIAFHEKNRSGSRISKQKSGFKKRSK